MKNFLSMAKGKLVNDGLQPTAKAKLNLLVDSEDAQPTFSLILENLGLHACLDAMDAAPYQHEDFIEKTLRLLAIDAAYRVMPLWENAEVSQDGLRDLMRLAHLYAHGQIEYEELQGRLWEIGQPIMQEGEPSRSLAAARSARDCALLAASLALAPSLHQAVEAVRDHHGDIARSCALRYKANQGHALRQAWDQGGPISFAATFAVTSKHVLAAVEAEIWYVAYTIADELLGFVGYENVEITEKEMESFLLEALESASEDIISEVPKAILESQNGIDQVSKIVQTLKRLAHPDNQSFVPIHLGEVFENIVNITRNEWKHIAVVKINCDPKLHLIQGIMGDINQIILNLMINAAQAIQERGAGDNTPGEITLEARNNDEAVEITVQDNGCGIPESISHRVFDPFFTTKEVGKGTGQGLGIVHSLVEKNHGKIFFSSVVGEGTTFTIHFPSSKEITDTAC